MDGGANSISIISAKSLDNASAATSAKPGVYVNQAYDGDDGKTTASAGPSTTPSAGSNGLYDDIHHMRKGHHRGSVDFTMPQNRRIDSRDRLKSISEGGPYRGMGKDELLRFSSQPLWRNLRYACISIVLAGWLALLITVVALVLTYPQCRESQSTAWWQRAVIYRIYVPSFMDAEGMDGIGDIHGIRNRLDYIKSTGADTISLSPIYKLSANAPTDTHIVDHKDIDPAHGTLNEFKLLVNETHSRDMYITIDFIPNHTSDEHPWFLASKADPDARGNEFRSYYVWTEGDGPINNWKSVYGCSAWEEYGNGNTSSYYLHQFTESQPDLDLRSDKVKEELMDILEFWLDLGVDGFYLRDTDLLFEDYDMRDESLIDNTTRKSQFCGLSGNEYRYEELHHEYTRGLDQNFDMVARWRSLLDHFGNKTKQYRIMFSDVSGPMSHILDYYGLFNRDGVDFPLNTFTHNLNTSSNGADVGNLVSDWMKNVPAGRWSNWMSGDDRIPRLADRLGSQLAKTYLALMMLLPGTPFIYYGDEIGMRGSPVPHTLPAWDKKKPMRGPMLWNNKINHGFCVPHCYQPWMNQSVSESGRVDAEALMTDPDSIWHLLKNLTDLRRDNPSFEYGDFHTAFHDQQVYSFVREFDGEKGYLIAVNFGPDMTHRTFTGTHETVPSGATVELVTGPLSGLYKGGGADLNPLQLAAGEGVVVSWDYEAKEL